MGTMLFLWLIFTYKNLAKSLGFLRFFHKHFNIVCFEIIQYNVEKINGIKWNSNILIFSC